MSQVSALSNKPTLLAEIGKVLSRVSTSSQIKKTRFSEE